MTKITHKPLIQKSGNFENNYEVTGNNIDSLVEHCLPLIREKSKSFYEKELREKLETYGKAFIDVHAGKGTTYEVVLKQVKVTKRFVSDGKRYRVVLDGKSVTLFLQGNKECLAGTLCNSGESLLSVGKHLLNLYNKTNSSKTIEEMFG